VVSEMTFLAIVLALACYMLADFAFPYVFPEKKKKKIKAEAKKVAGMRR